MNQTQTIKHRFYSPMLHMEDDDLGPYEYRLLGHYKRVCGQDGKCFEATPTTAEKCKMSVGMVSKAKNTLIEMGYIRRQSRKGTSDLITLVDRMRENIARYTRRSPHEQTPASDERGRSPDETKYNQIKYNQQEHAGVGVDTFSLTGERDLSGEPPQDIHREPHDRTLTEQQQWCVANGINYVTLEVDINRYPLAYLDTWYAYAVAHSVAATGKKNGIRDVNGFLVAQFNGGAPAPKVPDPEPEPEPDTFNKFSNTPGPGGNIFEGMDRTLHPPPKKTLLEERIVALRDSRGLDACGERAWGIAHNQLEIQFDRASFDKWLKGIHYVGNGGPACFVLAVEHHYALDMLQHRLYRNVRRVLSDSYGQDCEIEFVLIEKQRAPALAGGAS